MPSTNTNSPAELRVLVFSSLFPSDAAPTAGTFIRERMMRVARRVPLVIVAPQPWSPLDGLIRLWRHSFRPQGKAFELIDGVEVHRPKYLSVPGVLKRFDGILMAWFSMRTVGELVTRFRPTVVDAHFLFPDGYAAMRLARRFSLPFTVTIRGSKDEWLIGTDRESRLRDVLQASNHLFAVSDALRRDVAIRLGTAAEKVTVIGNGVDTTRFARVDRQQVRNRLGIAPATRVIIGVGGLIERKGFHRIIPLLPAIRRVFPDLLYLIVGGGTTQDDMLPRLQRLAIDHGVQDIVRFCGPQVPDELRHFYSAADVFALATAHEGWANVFLEAMACGLPVVTTAVGGNAEVVRSPDLGRVVPFDDPQAFRTALEEALASAWDREAIVAYARANDWKPRIDVLVENLRTVAATGAARSTGPGAA